MQILGCYRRHHKSKFARGPGAHPAQPAPCLLRRLFRTTRVYEPFKKRIKRLAYSSFAWLSVKTKYNNGPSVL